jgi:hypothetical protein
MSAQATRVNQLVTASLGLDVEQSRWRALTRQISQQDPLAGRLRSVGGAVDVGYLDRALSLDEVRRAVSERQAPLVLLSADDATAVVFQADDTDGGITARVVARDGGVTELQGTADTLADAVLAQLGSAKPVRAMVPMALRSATAAVGDGAPHSPVGHDHDEGEEEHRTPVERTFALMARERREILTVFFYATLAGGLSLILPLAVGGIVQLVQGRLFLQPVIVLISFVILGTIVAGVLQIGILRVVERIQQRVFARMALEFAFRVPRMKYSASMEQNLPEQMNRLFEAVAIQKGVQKLLIDVPTAVLTVMFGLILLTVYSPWFSLFAVVVLFILYLIIKWTGPEGLATSIVESKYKYKAVHWLEEIARAVHAFKYAGDSTLPVERMDDVITA